VGSVGGKREHAFLPIPLSSHPSPLDLRVMDSLKSRVDYWYKLSKSGNFYI
jgi:hypothetical protein